MPASAAAPVDGGRWRRRLEYSVLACHHQYVCYSGSVVRSKAAAGQTRERIDTLLVGRGMTESRHRAQALLLAGEVSVDGAVIMKPGTLVRTAAQIEVRQHPRYVSRGGEKLAHALGTFGIDVTGFVCADIGASTGGFTDCLLQAGASRVYAVDVGYGELDYGLRRDERVVVMERTNARDLSPLPETCDLVVMDVSFIGAEKVIPAVRRSLRPGGRMVVLVKPQFQGRREEVGKGGVVRDSLTHASILGRLIAWSTEEGLRLRGLTTSPLLGPAGNKEFFFLLQPAAGRGDPRE
jgi:23S rRNA (cytidine1920-2'-O)/16S rRNA (cytidine1409-2'-O)-methyltransferase